jgi:hypothetical protein
MRKGKKIQREYQPTITTKITALMRSPVFLMRSRDLSIPTHRKAAKRALKALGFVAIPTTKPRQNDLLHNLA